ncbi:MAG: long-chain-fatty-acid--CoA ligase [Acetobacteraceae bacterium]
MDSFQGCTTLAGLAPLHARERPTSVALRFGDRTTTYAELDAHSNQVARALAAQGLRQGDRVAYLGKNSDHYFELMFGCAKANMIFVPVNWRLAGPELSGILGDADPRILFAGPGFEAAAAALDIPGLVARLPMAGATGYAAWRDAQSADPVNTPVDPADTALILYTSGTTGLPKGVELTHANMIALLASYTGSGVTGMGPGERCIVCLPPYHVAGTGVGLMGLATGSSITVLEEVNVAQIIETIVRDRISSLLLVPAVILMVTQHCEANPVDLSSVRNLAYGASPIAEDVLTRAMRVFANARFCQVYGSTEGSAIATFLPPADHDPARGKLRSCGKVHAGTELRIADADGTAVPTGQVGEIVLRGPGVMKGYWRNPDATRATFFPDGWMRTGDAAYLDAEGFVYIYDRVKDMIVSGAENVYPAEVENAIFGHPAVADVAVIGVPDPRWGEAVKAIVVPKAGMAPNAEEIIGYARERIAGYKLPKSVDFVDALPRNPTGKVLRRELREPYWRGQTRQVG